MLVVVVVVMNGGDGSGSDAGSLVVCWLVVGSLWLVLVGL